MNNEKHSSGKLRILMFGHKYVPSREGGIEIVVDELASRLSSQGHSVLLYNRKRSEYQRRDEYHECKLEEVFTINKGFLDATIYSFFSTLKARRLAKKEQVDVIHIHAEGPCAFLSLLGKKHKGYKVVVTIHGLDWQRGKWSGFATAFLRYCERQAVKYADEIIVLSQNNKKYFREHYHRTTSYCPNGIEIPNIVQADLITQKYGLHKDDYILFLARIVPEKGVHYLIDAWQLVKEQLETDKKLVIAGGSSHTDEYYSEICEKCKNDDSIIMTGFVQGQILAELYSNSYLYVLPSDIEGMPMSLLEALSYGNIALVSDIPENTEVINGDCFVFKSGDVDNLRHQIKKIIRLNIKTHENVIQPYSWNEVVERTMELYKR